MKGYVYARARTHIQQHVAHPLSLQCVEIEVDYTTTCSATQPHGVLYWHVPEDIPPPVYLYYKVYNYYQNHRAYVKSISIEQLTGEALSEHQLQHCAPYASERVGNRTLIYYPSGAIANGRLLGSTCSHLRAPWS